VPDLKIRQYDVQPMLGRHLVLDPRSLAYRRRYQGEPIKPVEWAPKVPVLNQQNLLGQGIRTGQLFQGVDDVDALGSCTANAATALVSVLHDAATLAEAHWTSPTRRPPKPGPSTSTRTRHTAISGWTTPGQPSTAALPDSASPKPSAPAA
jgi:hypothetical protein